MIMDAVEIDKQRIADGILVGDEISGWVGPSAVDDALSLINEMMLGYEMNGISGRKEIFEKNNVAAPGGMDGPWSFIDLDQVERFTIKTNTIMHADNLVKQYKTESAALTNHQKQFYQTILNWLQVVVKDLSMIHLLCWIRKVM